MKWKIIDKGNKNNFLLILYPFSDKNVTYGFNVTKSDLFNLFLLLKDIVHNEDIIVETKETTAKLNSEIINLNLDSHIIKTEQPVCSDNPDSTEEKCIEQQEEIEQEPQETEEKDQPIQDSDKTQDKSHESEEESDDIFEAKIEYPKDKKGFFHAVRKFFGLE